MMMTPNATMTLTDSRRNAVRFELHKHISSPMNVDKGNNQVNEFQLEAIENPTRANQDGEPAGKSFQQAAVYEETTMSHNYQRNLMELKLFTRRWHPP